MKMEFSISDNAFAELSTASSEERLREHLSKIKQDRGLRS